MKRRALDEAAAILDGLDEALGQLIELLRQDPALRQRMRRPRRPLRVVPEAGERDRRRLPPGRVGA